MHLKSHGRFDYSAITARPLYDWPNGTRLAVYLAVNLEHFSFGEGLGAELCPGGPQPDVLNYSWREYGNRVGAWRMLELFDQLGLPASILLNTALYDHAPELLAAFRARGDEMVGHGRTNAERQGTLDEAHEAALIEQATALMQRYEGNRPAGWLGPWISQSRVTPDLLHEAGYTYLLDWCMDDQPVWMRTRRGRILSVPYPQELNDIPMIVGRNALHPYLVGQPHRLRHLRRALQHIGARRDQIWLTTAGAVAAHAASLPAGVIPGN